MQKLLLFIPAVLLCVAARADVIEPATAIVRFPATISKAGTYVVASNLIYKGTTGYAITVNASDVIIDLNEHTVSNILPATSGSVTTAACIGMVGDSNLTVRNGTITGFNDGVYTSSETAPSLQRIENTTFTHCSNAGVNLSGDVVEVINCHAIACGNFGLVINNSNYATMSGNFVYNVTGGSGGLSDCRGIEASANYTCTVTGNQVVNSLSAHGFIGIGIFCEFGYSSAKDNVVSGWNYGLNFTNGSPGKYLNNLTEDCTTPFSGGTAITGNN